MEYKGKVEYAQERKMRTRNTRIYRLAHWPIWIFVFFLAPGPLTFSLFAHGFSVGNSLWLGVVLAGTGVAALRGRLPGAEPGPYILRFDEDKPNPLYRRVCYTFAWNAVLNYALLNLAAFDRRGNRRVAHEADLRLCLPAAGRADSAAGALASCRAWNPQRSRKAHRGGTSTARCGR